MSDDRFETLAAGYRVLERIVRDAASVHEGMVCVHGETADIAYRDSVNLMDTTERELVRRASHLV
jgi:hypothetical protein